MPRPRSIPEEQVLERALLLFWNQGYDRTSIADLCAAIGVGPSSLYNAYGSKLKLFRMALGHYVERHTGALREVLESDQPAHEALRKLLRGLVRVYTATDTPAGCAILQAGGSGSPADSEACAVTLEIKAEVEKRLRKLLEARAAAGDELAAPPRTLAKFVLGTMRGLSQLACDGSSQAELLRVADHAAQSCTTQ